MVDNPNGSGLPNPNAAPATQDKPPQPLSATDLHLQAKRNHRQRKNQSQTQMDGTVSDSVTNPVASPHSKKGSKQRQQSVAIGALPHQNGNMGKVNGQKPRPVSFGGSMLPATPLKEQAYAGPTFQASPAPSSLPVPKFFSRSVPNVAAPQSLEARMAGEKTPEKEQSSPELEAVAPPRESQQSPLDLFFKADKAEKEKSRSGSMLSPEMAAKRPLPATEPRNSFAPSSKSIFLSELDGGDGAMPSPKTLPPAKRGGPVEGTSSSPGVRVPEADNESEREQFTKSLKDLLLNNASAAPAQHPPPPLILQRPRSNPKASETSFITPSPFHRSTSGPSTPAPSSEQQNHYSLHYGNRNLSPLFKAARSDTPSRPSGLRQQELAGDVPSDTTSATDIPPQPRQLPQIDPDSFSRTYLDQHIRASQPATLPQLPYTNGTTNHSNPTSGPSQSHSPQRGLQAGSTASPRTGGSASRDIRTMEDDLRRKLNILSN